MMSSVMILTLLSGSPDVFQYLAGMIFHFQVYRSLLLLYCYFFITLHTNSYKLHLLTLGVKHGLSLSLFLSVS